MPKLEMMVAGNKDFPYGSVQIGMKLANARV